MQFKIKTDELMFLYREAATRSHEYRVQADLLFTMFLNGSFHVDFLTARLLELSNLYQDETVRLARQTTEVTP